MSRPALFESHLSTLSLVHRGKVRDIYDVDEQHLLIVTTDRLSAFDVILPTPIPGKGEVLTAVSRFWFDRSRDIVPNHLAETPTLEDIIPDPAQRAPLEGRSMVVRKLRALPVEAIVRGYLIGSGYKDYLAHGSVCGIPLPTGLQMADRLPEPIYTPSSKAAVGDHDENITYEDTVALLGESLAAQVRDTALALYRHAAEYARGRDIIIADTKFEFGVDAQEQLYLIDEALTPDSSRFWPAESYRPGSSPPSFDKQYIRDWLETLDWDKRPPGPEVPPEVVAQTTARYQEALERLTGTADPAPAT
ncbi:MAG: phosphoribosylaminoimidazolesuccinocarboxamide synthase [Halothiobacillaceae bacterium]